MPEIQKPTGKKFADNPKNNRKIFCNRKDRAYLCLFLSNIVITEET